MVTINMNKEFGNYIVTRRAMHEFFSKMRKLETTKIVFDFSNIKFISRSCADEYVKQRESSDKDFQVINLSQDVTTMLQLVTIAPQEKKIYHKPTAVLLL